MKAPCQSEACKRGLREFREKQRRENVRANLEPEAYDDQEVRRLHEARLRAGYAAACERLPKGFRMTWETWIATIGDEGTVFMEKPVCGQRRGKQEAL
jgi:hypothetical protein